MTRGIAEGVRRTSVLLEARLGPFPLERALELLPGQGDLATPAKLVSRTDGRGGLLIEVPRRGEDRLSERPLAEAVDAGRAWVEGRRPRRRRRAPVEVDPGAIESTLGLLPWTWEPVDDGGYRIDVSGDGVDCRLRIRIERGVVRLSVPSTPIPLEEGPGADAMRLFALAANRSLRLARIGVGGADGGAVRVVWDAVLPGELADTTVLERAIEALVGARAETLRPLRALGRASVARRYMDLRAGGGAPRTGPNDNPRPGSAARKEK